MRGEDFSTFERAFRRVCGAFRLKLKNEEFTELAQTYFRLLELHALAEVLDAGKRLISTSRRFPLAVDWLNAIERPNQPTDRRQMGAGELAEYEAAERERFENPPCWCVECRAAHVEDRPIRFVPSMRSADEYETAWNPKRARVDIVGHWAHGSELARWYAARDEFFSHAKRSKVFSMAARLFVREDLPEREIGEEG